MTETTQLIQSFHTTHWLIKEFVDGMNHEESVAQPPFRANSLNWVLGHIVASRNRVLALLEEEPALSASEEALYRTGSDPATGSAVALERLVAALDDSQARIKAALQMITPERLAVVQDEERQRTVADLLAGLHWHETYHTGQLEILRQVSGERKAFP